MLGSTYINFCLVLGMSGSLRASHWNQIPVENYSSGSCDVVHQEDLDEKIKKILKFAQGYTWKNHMCDFNPDTCSVYLKIFYDLKLVFKDEHAEKAYASLKTEFKKNPQESLLWVFEVDTHPFLRILRKSFVTLYGPCVSKHLLFLAYVKINGASYDPDHYAEKCTTLLSIFFQKRQSLLMEMIRKKTRPCVDLEARIQKQRLDFFESISRTKKKKSWHLLEEFREQLKPQINDLLFLKTELSILKLYKN